VAASRTSKRPNTRTTKKRTTNEPKRAVKRKGIVASSRTSKRPNTRTTKKTTTNEPKRAVKRKIAPAAPLPPLPESGAFVQKADPAVRDILNASSPLGSFLAGAGGLTPDERALIVDQAIVLMEGFYVHLPLKKAMHAVDPVQRLRLLRKHLSEYDHDARFHGEMTQIFTSVRDLHTNYLLPSPFSHVFASLPFRVETCVEDGKVVYLVAGLATGFQHPTFTVGVELQYWNGMPIDRAVEIAADRHAGSNADARLARGLAGLTQRPLVIVPPPDEEWAIINYKALDGSNQQIRLDWLVVGLPPAAGSASGTTASAVATGLDLETELTQRARRILFAPHAEAARAKIDAAADALAAVSDTESIMPEVFTAREVTTSYGKFGHIRIWTFNVAEPDEFVQEFVRLAGLLPQNGLVVDVRDNGGGLIYAGEQLLQVLTPRTIEPERLQFVNTPMTLRLCELNAPSRTVSNLDLSPWLPSMQRAVETGSAFSASFPITSPEGCNAIGQCYFGPVVLITSARCYSTTDIFSAGFQDHAIGKILGVDGHTGAGGANVWEHPLLDRLFSTAGASPKLLADSPIKPLPKGANMRVAIRRTLRVRAQAGTELEDLGVVPDERHSMTRADILNKNVDLMEHAGKLLSGMPVVQMTIKVTAGAGDTLKIQVDTQNVDRLDFYLDSHPQRSEAVSPQDGSVAVELTQRGGKVLQLQGFRQDKLVAARRVAL
jgi:C-terminal processing protease CtpA/Prc